MEPEVTEDSIVIPSRRGRPKADEPRATVCTWVPSSDHDRLIAIARRRRMSVSGLVRQILRTQLQRG